MKFDYDAYEACFNTGDDEELVQRFFCDDIVFTGGARAYSGKEELLAFLAWAHDGVREVMRPQLVLQNGDDLFAEVDMDFHATRERPEFPFGHLFPGDMVTVKFFVTYRLRDGKVKELKAMTWAPEKDVTKLPRLGGHPSQIAALRSYLAAFSNADCARFPRFYANDVVLRLNDKIPPLVGPDAIAGFYEAMFRKVRENLTVHSIEATDEAIRIDATARFTAIEDAPDFVLGALRKGDCIDNRVFVDYTLKEGLIATIGVVRQGEMIFHRSAEIAVGS